MGPPHRSRAPSELVVGEAVHIVEWPIADELFEELVRTRTPRLVVVEEGHEPPVAPDCCQDWMWRTGEEPELRQRVRQLALRALAHGHSRPHLDTLGFLHVGLRSVHLPPKEAALAAILVASFNDPVTPERLIRSGWPEGIRSPNVLAHRISALRGRLVWLGLEIRGSSRKGYTMEVRAHVDDTDEGGGFEDELPTANLFGSEGSRRPSG